MRRVGRRAPLALFLALVAGSTYYPTVRDTGGPRIPGESRLDFRPDGLRITLSELTGPLVLGKGVIVTLVFVKSGRIGVVSKVE